jgi:hypothetical protein
MMPARRPLQVGLVFIECRISRPRVAERRLRAFEDRLDNPQQHRTDKGTRQ